MAFSQLEPFGALADELRLGQIAATIANVNRDEKTDAYRSGDFMPALGAELARQRAPLIDKELSAEERSALLDATLFGKN